ncbi:MAG: hypothetical protein LBE91_08940 [Tannerella sp.]|jgi:rubredoxin|nr:hypothetical protein [Tannerella sp.]
MLKEMQEIKERFFVFIDKLEAKLREFAEASLPELEEMGRTDPDEYKGAYNRMKFAVLGQVESIMRKAREVRDEKVTNFAFSSGDFNMSKAYYSFRDECYEKFNELEALKDMYRDRIENSYVEDYEAKYQRILDEYEAIRDKFKCRQCGSPITIDRIYFITTYLSCPACGTKNTFEPSSQAKMLEHLGRSLAEQRTAHLLAAYNEMNALERELYHERHEMDLSLIHESNRKMVAEKESQMAELENRRKQAIKEAPDLYRKYLRAMFDEWNKITPDLAEEHEKFHLRMVEEFNKSL